MSVYLKVPWQCTKCHQKRLKDTDSTSLGSIYKDVVSAWVVEIGSSKAHLDRKISLSEISQTIISPHGKEGSSPNNPWRVRSICIGCNYYRQIAREILR